MPIRLVAPVQFTRQPPNCIPLIAFEVTFVPLKIHLTLDIYSIFFVVTFFNFMWHIIQFKVHNLR